MPALFTEDTYEQAIIELFENMGYEHIYAPDYERDYTNPLLESVLKDNLVRINSDLPEEAIQEAISKIKNFDTGSLLQKNVIFMDYLQNGITVKYFVKGEERSGIVHLIDFEAERDKKKRNSFYIVNQFTFLENRNNRRPDIILFINGLPLVLMELKSPAKDEVGAENAYNQIRNYMQDIPSLFYYNAICVISDLSTNKAGTITSGFDRFMEWKTKDGNNEEISYAQFDTFYEGIFQRERLLDILKNFILFSGSSTKRFKILAGYHQYFAVHKAVEKAIVATKTDGKGGVFWHTQGSGKSLSMVFYAHLLQKVLESPTLIVMTDRIDLDDQLYTQFSQCADFLRQTPIQAESKEHLKTLLDGRSANGIIFTTMFKFERGEKPLSERRNIVVMADEAHRGQYGFDEKIVISENEKGQKEARTIVGNARVVHDALPNATFIGFTGTPISAKDRNTREVFGDYIDIYDMTQAVEDGATRPVYYESRVVHLKLDENTLALIDSTYDVLEKQSDTATIEKSKKMLGQMKEYTKRDQSRYGDMDIAKVAYPKFQEKLQVCKDLLHGFDFSGFIGGSPLTMAKLITGGVNFVLDASKPERKELFLKEAMLLKQSHSLCSSMTTEIERHEAAYMEAVRSTVIKITYGGSGGKSLSLKEINAQINDLLKAAVQSEGVINLFDSSEMAGEEFSLFDPAVLDEIARMKEKNIAVEILKKLMSEQVSLYKRTNIVQSQKFSEKITKLMNAYYNGLITNEEVIKELMKTAEEIKILYKNGKKLGLTQEELAFYDALTKPEHIKDFYKNDELIKLTRELTEMLRKNRTIDWQKKETARATMRKMVKRLLKRYHYPPEEYDFAINTVISQCELWSDNA